MLLLSGTHIVSGAICLAGAMPHRRKLDLEKIRASLDTVCPHCNASIPPEDQNRADSERMKCPHCGEVFIPAKREK